MASANKTYFAGEYAWNSKAASSDADLSLWFREMEKHPAIIGDTFWSLFGHNEPDCTVSPEKHPSGPSLALFQDIVG